MATDLVCCFCSMFGVCFWLCLVLVSVDFSLLFVRSSLARSFERCFILLRVNDLLLL